MIRTPKLSAPAAEPDRSLREELIARLVDLQPEFQRRLDATMPAHVRQLRADLHDLMGNTTLRQLEVVRTLAAHGPLAMHELAELQGTTPSSITELADRLVEHGLVERRHRSEDLRTVEVALTARAEVLVKRLKEARQATFTAVTAAYDYQELATLVHLMQKLAQRPPLDRERVAPS